MWEAEWVGGYVFSRVLQVGRTGYAKTQMHERTQHLRRTVNLKWLRIT